MNLPRTHVYFVPGLAAGKEIFENISLPEEAYELHIIEWVVPSKKESLIEYAKRMAVKVKEPNSVLIGVSFGGVVAQEMSLFLKLKRLIIISSLKTRFEIPKHLQYFKKTNAYKLFPTGLILSIKDLTNYAIGRKNKKKLLLYQEYLSVRDRQYLNWSIQQMVCWEREKAVDNVIHIHGDKDIVFPIKYIEKCILVKGGTHVLIINKFSWLNENLPKIIEDDYNL